MRSRRRSLAEPCLGGAFARPARLSRVFEGVCRIDFLSLDYLWEERKPPRIDPLETERGFDLRVIDVILQGYADAACLLGE